ncbi:MAG: hypothetical protein ACLFUB_18235 [Cyclobacteriaceae bacterium]
MRDHSYRPINEIMDLITDKFPDLKWKKHCLYSNGIDQHLMEIRIYCSPRQQVIGRIVYDGLTGKVQRMQYRKENMQNCGDIVDMLLDVINIEKHSMAMQ